MAKEKEDIHVVPVEDIIEHIEVEHCPCGTEWDEYNKADFLSGRVNHKVIVHNRLMDNPQ